jgi:hypothetical protein
MYMMYNECTRMMRTTHDVMWLNQMYFDSTNHPNVDTVVPIVDAQEGTFDLIDCKEGIQDDDTIPINNVVPEQQQMFNPLIQIPVLAPMPQPQDPTPFPLISPHICENLTDVDDEHDENLENEVVEDHVPAEWPQTRSGWQVKLPARFGDYVAAGHEEVPLTPTEIAYFRDMHLLIKLPDDFAFPAVSDGEWTVVQQRNGHANPQPENNVSLVGMAEGTVQNTTALQVMKHDTAMEINTIRWSAAVAEEYGKMLKNEVLSQSLNPKSCLIVASSAPCGQ